MKITDTQNIWKFCLAALALVASLGAQAAPSPVAAIPIAFDRPPSAEIVRTEYGIPHIRAASLEDAAFGVGYAAAEDNVCLLADQFTRVNSRRSRLFGADPANPLDPNLVSDLGLLALGIRAGAERLWPGLSKPTQALLEGYAEGYNRYVRQTPAAKLPAPCRDRAETVTPVVPQDVLAYLLLIGRETSGAAFLEAAYGAAPPDAPTPLRASGTLFLPKDLGSNAVAMGGRVTGQGGLLLGQPHFPYYGHLRFHEYHLEIPGHLNVRGAGLLGFPVPNIGFNRQLAWTHTVATSGHFAVYRLDLDSNDPTRYRLDGVPAPMERRTVRVEAKLRDGRLVPVERTFHRSRFGLLVALPGVLDWDRRHAYALWDANEENPAIIDVWLGLAAARSIPEVEAATASYRGIPWVNTLAADSEGRVYYADASRVPALPKTMALKPLAKALGFPVLVGNRGMRV